MVKKVQAKAAAVQAAYSVVQLNGPLGKGGTCCIARTATGIWDIWKKSVMGITLELN